MYEKRISYLEEAHKQLDNRIDEMESSGNFDDTKISELKKLRLTYKDELVKLRRLQWEEDHERVDFEDDR
jgi:hypothetical protein